MSEGACDHYGDHDFDPVTGRCAACGLVELARRQLAVQLGSLWDVAYLL